jgi:hypothetical protein
LYGCGACLRPWDRAHGTRICRHTGQPIRPDRQIPRWARNDKADCAATGSVVTAWPCALNYGPTGITSNVIAPA